MMEHEKHDELNKGDDKGNVPYEAYIYMFFYEALSRAKTCV